MLSGGIGMLKKFVSSILCVLMLAGCGATSAGSAVSAEKEAEQIVSELGLSDKITEMDERVVKGLFFFEEGLVEDAKLYMDSTNQNADLVGVFKTSDPAAVKQKVEDYLVTLKETTQMYNPDEVFKIDNAIVKEGKDQVIVIVADDIEKAGKVVESLVK